MKDHLLRELSAQGVGHRRVARGFRNYNNYRLRILLIGGGLTHPHLR